MNQKYTEAIGRFMHTLDRHELTLHSMLIWYRGELLFERYWAPYTRERPHRMYSITKTFISAGIGALLGEGKISLQDPIIKYFPDKLPDPVPKELQEMTIENMLRMQTCFYDIGNWFKPWVTDRTAYYFHCPVSKPAGTVFDYDSTGSYVLGALIERLSGKPLLEYLKEKFLNRIGGFENAEMLETPDGTAWGDSGLLCTSRDLLQFAKLVMNKGCWEGEQLLPRDYMENAVRPLVDTNIEFYVKYNTKGYGYKFWTTERNGFSMNGACNQHAICVPEKDFIVVCTGDCASKDSRTTDIYFRAVFEDLLDGLEGREQESYPLPGENLAIESLRMGEKQSPMEARLQDAVFACKENPMGIERMSLHFEEEKVVLKYKNAQGDKELAFGRKENIFQKFPQLGYSNQRGNVHELTGFMYDCACSCAWWDEQTLKLRVQLTDRYCGQLHVTMVFRDENTMGLRMFKKAEDCLREYEGVLGAYRI